ncbi:hypothetical protein OsJ_05281 [Oryza sativa Japonica Group]|uniref:Uncharacterized protein n=1 Tax=Oryza sativa subsp. japonica TaxID=39947 RepID=A3A2V9_ORYSJ|nr:hypothetical protein OsJ_05281 [Oryza sativa Japonica Group]
MAQSPRSLHTLISFGRGADGVDDDEATPASVDVGDAEGPGPRPRLRVRAAASSTFRPARLPRRRPPPTPTARGRPRSAPGSPGRDRFPKSASTGGESSSSSRRWRLRDLVGAGGRSRSDGKDKFAFLHHHAAAPPSSKLKTPPPPQQPQQKKQSAVKTKPAAKKGVVTEMDMATAHRLFYSKASAGGDRRPQQASYLTYRPAFSGLFALGRSQHHTAY